MPIIILYFHKQYNKNNVNSDFYINKEESEQKFWTFCVFILQHDNWPETVCQCVIPIIILLKLRIIGYLDLVKGLLQDMTLLWHPCFLNWCGIPRFEYTVKERIFVGLDLCSFLQISLPYCCAQCYVTWGAHLINVLLNPSVCLFYLVLELNATDSGAHVYVTAKRERRLFHCAVFQKFTNW